MKFQYVLPFLIFGLIAVALGVGLTLKPSEIPSALINKPVPEFTLPPVKGRTDGFSSADLKTGKPSLVNVFASWCIPCRAEHPVLTAFAKRGVAPLYGLNYKDKPDAARAFLDELGDPFTKIGADLNGRVSIDWGVYGVPETFVVSGDGRIIYKHIGPMTETTITDTILPLLEKLQP
jgi:cytochrome c biogenesis protein CcmG/thiol:disulfide interchange protein DsbE